MKNCTPPPHAIITTFNGSMITNANLLSSLFYLKHIKLYILDACFNHFANALKQGSNQYTNNGYENIGAINASTRPLP